MPRVHDPVKTSAHISYVPDGMNVRVPGRWAFVLKLSQTYLTVAAASQLSHKSGSAQTCTKMKIHALALLLLAPLTSAKTVSKNGATE